MALEKVQLPGWKRSDDDTHEELRKRGCQNPYKPLIKDIVVFYRISTRFCRVHFPERSFTDFRQDKLLGKWIDSEIKNHQEGCECSECFW